MKSRFRGWPQNRRFRW